MPRIATFLMFVGDECGKAEEAIRWYVTLFAGSEVKGIERWQPGEPGGQEGTVKVATFTLGGVEYMASDSAMNHQFTFTPSFSIFVTCDSEDEVNRLFETLSQGGGVLMPLADYGFSPRFGWVADKYGVSWQLSLAPGT